MKQKDSIIDYKVRLETVEERGVQMSIELQMAQDRIKGLEDKVLGMSKNNDERSVQNSKLGNAFRELRDMEKHLWAVRSEFQEIEKRVDELSTQSEDIKQHLSKSWFSRTFGF